MIVSRFRESIGEHDDLAVLVLELAASSLLYDYDEHHPRTDPCRLLDELESSSPARRREILDGLPVPNRDLPRTHSLFYGVWAAAPREALHRDRLHVVGEPPVKLNTRGLHELGIFLGEHVAGLLESSAGDVSAKERVIFVESLAFARKARDDAKNAVKPPLFTRPPIADLLNLSFYIKDFADAHLRRGRASVADWAVKDAAKLTTRALGARTLPSCRITDAVHRAENLWLARLESGAYGLLVKHGRSLTWQEGELDEMLASVPDAQCATRPRRSFFTR